MFQDKLDFIKDRVDTIGKLVMGQEPLEPGPTALKIRRVMEIVANLSILALLVVAVGKLGWSAWTVMAEQGVDAMILEQIGRNPKLILALLLLVLIALMIITAVTELLFRLREFTASLQLLALYGVYKVFKLIEGILAEKPEWKELFEMVTGA